MHALSCTRPPMIHRRWQADCPGTIFTNIDSLCANETSGDNSCRMKEHTSRTLAWIDIIPGSTETGNTNLKLEGSEWCGWTFSPSESFDDQLRCLSNSKARY